MAVASFEVAGDPAFWLVEATSERKPDLFALSLKLAVLARACGIADPDLVAEHVPATDWLAKAYQGFPARRVGRFFIYGSHWQGPVPWATVPITLDAALAFGSGEHESTQGCLLAIDALASRGKGWWRGRRRTLDMGAGSGILSIALAKTAPVAVDAVDISADSVASVTANARRNGVGRRVHAGWGDGMRASHLRGRSPYRLIVANILARPLTALAPALVGRLDKRGAVVLSGLVRWQEARVLASYRDQGLVLRRRIRLNAWSTLVLARPGRRVPPTARADHALAVCWHGDTGANDSSADQNDGTAARP